MAVRVDQKDEDAPESGPGPLGPDEPGQAKTLSRIPVIVFGAVILLISALWLSCHELSHPERPADDPPAPTEGVPPAARTLDPRLEHG